MDRVAAHAEHFDGKEEWSGDLIKGEVFDRKVLNIPVISEKVILDYVGQSMAVDGVGGRSAGHLVG